MVLTINVVMSGDKIAGFDEVADLVEILQLYKKGQYKNINEFLPEFQSELIKYIHNGFPKMTSFPTELSPESTESFTLDGKTYKAFYCGSQDVSDYSDYVCRNFFRIEDGDFYEGIPITCCFWIE